MVMVHKLAERYPRTLAKGVGFMARNKFPDADLEAIEYAARQLCSAEWGDQWRGWASGRVPLLMNAMQFRSSRKHVEAMRREIERYPKIKADREWKARREAERRERERGIKDHEQR